MNKASIGKLVYFLLVLFLVSEPLILVGIVINLKDSYEIAPIEYTSEHIYAVKSRSKNSTVDHIMPLDYEYNNSTICIPNVAFPLVENPQIKEVRIILLSTFIYRDIKHITINLDAEHRLEVAPIEVGVLAAEEITNSFWVKAGQSLYVQSGGISDEIIVDISTAQAYYLEYATKYVVVYFRFDPNILADSLSLRIHIEFYHGKISLSRHIKVVYVGLLFVAVNLTLVTSLLILRNKPAPQYKSWHFKIGTEYKGL